MSISPRPVSTHRLRHTVGTLAFASAVCVLMWCVRALLANGHPMRFAGFNWNLFLAWIPLWLAFAVRRQAIGGKLTNTGWLLGIAWLLFFPNAFYIVTDLVHFKKFGEDGIPKLYDIMMTVAFACGGMFLGCLSLYLLQLTVRERLGWRAGWGFSLTMLALGSIGVHLGRDLRLNSWDIVQPPKLLRRLARLAEPAEMHEALVFISAFFFLSLAVYAFVASMARIHEVEEEKPAAS